MVIKPIIFSYQKVRVVSVSVGPQPAIASSGFYTAKSQNLRLHKDLHLM